MFKKHIILLIPSIAAAPLFTLSECSILVPVSLKPRPQKPSLLRFVSSHKPEQVLLPTLFTSTNVFAITAMLGEWLRGLTV